MSWRYIILIFSVLLPFLWAVLNANHTSEDIQKITQDTIVVILIFPNDCQNYHSAIRRFYTQFIPAGSKDCYHTIFPLMRRVEQDYLLESLEIDTLKTVVVCSDSLFNAYFQMLLSKPPTSHITFLNTSNNSFTKQSRFKDLSFAHQFEDFILSNCLRK